MNVKKSIIGLLGVLGLFLFFEKNNFLQAQETMSAPVSDYAVLLQNDTQGIAVLDLNQCDPIKMVQTVSNIAIDIIDKTAKTPEVAQQQKLLVTLLPMLVMKPSTFVAKAKALHAAKVYFIVGSEEDAPYFDFFTAFSTVGMSKQEIADLGALLTERFAPDLMFNRNGFLYSVKAKPDGKSVDELRTYVKKRFKTPSDSPNQDLIDLFETVKDEPAAFAAYKSYVFGQNKGSVNFQPAGEEDAKFQRMKKAVQKMRDTSQKNLKGATGVLNPSVPSIEYVTVLDAEDGAAAMLGAYLDFLPPLLQIFGTDAQTGDMFLNADELQAIMRLVTPKKDGSRLIYRIDKDSVQRLSADLETVFQLIKKNSDKKIGIQPELQIQDNSIEFDEELFPEE